ncbi:MAG: nucleoid-associated protein [Bacteroidales bacterium]|nr:nucleoid-associated protein [Bacteroidales bacterium]MCF8390511.1 nucleoid-associated protein [Bacteroidales bacterium]
MIDYTNCRIEKVAVHKVGNKTKQEDLHLSKSLLDTSNEKLEGMLLRYFLNPFSAPEFHSFTFSNDDFTLNPIFVFASQIFDSVESFHSNSVNLAKHLFELSVHPNIKSGDLFLAYFSNISFEDEMTDAIGIYKSENKHSFLKLEKSNDDFIVYSEDGINIDKLDKACLIFNTDRANGYKVCSIDKSNKTIDAHFWRDNFLQIKPCADSYHLTKDFMNITKNFVTKKLTEDFEVSKADQIDLLNRSVEYFKNNESFDKQGFENEVFIDREVIKSFQNFDEAYRKDNEIKIDNNFEVSPQAVKKQSRIFKSVLKLDKNFHIYIHGDRQLIEQGVDKDGRKYYKIYFENER